MTTAERDNPAAARLEAIVHVLLGGDGPDDLAQRQRHARDLMALHDDEVEHLGTAPAGSASAHARGDFLGAFARPYAMAPRVPAGQHVGAQRGGTWVAARALAEFYADYYSALAGAGQPPTVEDLGHARAEIEPNFWTVVEEGGAYEARPLAGPEAAEEEEEDEGPERLFRPGRAAHYAAAHAPKGGVTIGGKQYAGGQFIPAAAVARASPEDRERIADAERQRHEQAKARNDLRRARGPVDRQALAARLEPHAAAVGPSGRREQASVARSWQGLVRFHGEGALHRVEELADQAEAALASLADDAKNKNRRYELRKQLARLHALADLAGRPAPQRRGGREGPEDGRPPARPVPGRVYNVQTEQLQVDPGRFQFKLNVDRSGVTPELKEVRTWSPDFAGVVSVWLDPADLKTYVVNGHHRRELAGRLGVPQMAVRYIQADTAEKARAVGALINMAEGRGTAVDAAKFLRDSGLRPEALADYGISLKGKLARDAAALEQLSGALFGKVAGGLIDPDRAVGVASHLADHALQEALFRQIDLQEERTGRELGPRVVAEMAREVAATPTARTTEKTLFGDWESEESLFVPRNELKAFVRGELAKQQRDFAAVASERRAEAVRDKGNVLNIEENQRAAEEAGRLLGTFDLLINRKGPASDALNELAGDYHRARAPRDRDAVRKQALARLRGALQSELDSASVGAPGAPGAPGADRAGPAGGAPRGGAADHLEPAASAAPPAPDGRGAGAAVRDLTPPGPALAGALPEPDGAAAGALRALAAAEAALGEMDQAGEQEQAEARERVAQADRALREAAGAARRRREARRPERPAELPAGSPADLGGYLKGALQPGAKFSIAGRPETRFTVARVNKTTVSGTNGVTYKHADVLPIDRASGSPLRPEELAEAVARWAARERPPAAPAESPHDGPFTAVVGGKAVEGDAGHVASRIEEQLRPAATPGLTPEAPPVAEGPSGPAISPHVALARQLADELRTGAAITASDLRRLAAAAHGGTMAEGRYGYSEATDSLEAGLNRALGGRTDPNLPLAQAQAQAREIAARVNQLPTQTNRSGEKEGHQQFSTPPHYAYAAAWLANLSPGEVVLEPSAGTGCLATQAQNAGATVYLNELSARRAELLADQFGADRVHTEDALQIAGILPGRGVPRPTAVLMNPPFSQTAGRLGGRKELMTGARHIDEALRLLAPGGRLVAIVGRGMAEDSPTFRDWFARLKRGHSLRANVGLAGAEYTKYGTHFDTRVLVIDKAGPHQGATVAGDAPDVPALMGLLEGVRNDRPRPSQPAPGEPAGREPPPPGGPGAGRPDDAPAPVVPGVAAGAAGAGGGAAPGAGGPVAGEPPGLGGGPAGGQLPGTGGGPGAGAGGPGVGGAGAAPAGAGGGDREGAKRRRGGKAPGGEPAGEPARRLPQLQPPRPVELGPPGPPPATPSATPQGATSPEGREAQSQADLGPSLFESYSPQRARVRGAKRHVTPLVESAAMAAVKPPAATYAPMLPPELVAAGALSDAQLEPIVYAGQAHEKFLPAGEGEAPVRRGFMVGDGTGVGKGRIIAGALIDNMARGRRRHAWVSQKQNLIEDAKRDWRDLGQDVGQLHHFDAIRKGENVPQEGVAFITYDTLKSAPKDATKKSNLDQLVEWLGPDFDGVVAFDEAHSMSNSIETEGARGGKGPSQKALAGVELQRRLPKARVLYVSATGATEVSNLAYAERLGLWGRGTAFPDKQQFIAQMEKGGVAAMESVAQSMKAQGSYTARSLSFDDGTPAGRVTYERLTHKLSPEQRATYDGLADAWQKVLQNIGKALEATGVVAAGGGKALSKNARSAALSQFWGAQQRFFNQVMTSMQTPSVIRAMEQDLAEGRAPVVQLVNTMEAATKRAREKLGDDGDLEQMDVSPREVLMQYLEKSFPVHRWEQYQDESGNALSRLVKNSDGEPVIDPEAARLRDEMLDLVGTLRIPESPLDLILHHFGQEQVAEATGRTQRLVYEEQEDGTRKKVLQRRNAVQANAADTSAFQSGQKKIMVFSDAGGTGRSYHAARNEANQSQRVHYMLQPGWRADNAVQGLGRTHRTNQVQAPTYRLVEIDDLKAQKRFVSTIARRLDQLGALTRGQRQAGSGGLFSAADNLESPQAAEALGAFFRDLRAGRVEGLSHDEVMAQLGFKTKEDEAGEARSGRRKEPEAPPMGQFLNRLLSLRVDMQAKVFEAFERRLADAVERAAREGTLDTGVENFPATSMARQGDRVVYSDPESGAEVRHLAVLARRKADKLSWDKLGEGERPLGFVRNKQSGRVYALYKALDRTDARTGRIVPQYRLEGPTGTKQFRPRHEVPDHPTAYSYGNFDRLDAGAAEPLWRAEHDEAVDFEEAEENFLVGALLPIWDRIPGDRPKVYRIKTTDGETVVGRHVAPRAVPEMLRRLGVSAQGKAHDPERAHAQLSSGRATATLANGWSLRPVRVQNERRIELIGPGAAHLAELAADGAIRERINYATRVFVPTGPAGAAVLARITRSRPIVELDRLEQFARRGPGPGLAARFAQLSRAALARGDRFSAAIYARQARGEG